MWIQEHPCMPNYSPPGAWQIAEMPSDVRDSAEGGVGLTVRHARVAAWRLPCARPASREHGRREHGRRERMLGVVRGVWVSFVSPATFVSLAAAAAARGEMGRVTNGIFQGAACRVQGAGLVRAAAAHDCVRHMNESRQRLEWRTARSSPHDDDCAVRRARTAGTRSGEIARASAWTRRKTARLACR